MRWHNVQMTVEIMVSDDYDSITEDVDKITMEEAKKKVEDALKVGMREWSCVTNPRVVHTRVGE